MIRGIIGIAIAFLPLVDLVFFRICSIGDILLPYWYVDNITLMNNLWEVFVVLLIVYTMVTGIWLIKKHRARKNAN